MPCCRECPFRLSVCTLPLAEAACEVDGVGKSAGGSEPARRHWEFGTSRLSLLERHALAELYVRMLGTLASWRAWGDCLPVLLVFIDVGK